MTTVVGILMIETFIFSLPASSFSLSPLLSFSFFPPFLAFSLSPDKFSQVLFSLSLFVYQLSLRETLFCNFFQLSFRWNCNQKSLTHSIHFLLILVFVTSEISFLLFSSPLSSSFHSSFPFHSPFLQFGRESWLALIQQGWMLLLSGLL